MRRLLIVLFAAWAGCSGAGPASTFAQPSAAGAVAVAPAAGNSDPVAAAAAAATDGGAPIVVATTAPAPTPPPAAEAPANPGSDEVYTDGPVVPADVDPNKLRPASPTK